MGMLCLGVSVYVMYRRDIQSLNLTNTEHQEFKEGLIFSYAEL